MREYSETEGRNSFDMSSEYIGEFDNIYNLLTSLMENMIDLFKQETGYGHPLIAPQGNIVFVVDSTLAQNMITYFSGILINRMHFAKEEFTFTRKSSHDGAGLQRIRLEFTHGVSSKTIQKIMLSLQEPKLASN